MTVIVLNWNNAAMTLRCLEALRTQDYPSYNVLVVDNGSSEDVASILTERAPFARLIRLEQNMGYAGGNNAGFEHALMEGSEYICVLNNDVVASPDLITQLATTARSRPELGVVAATLYDPGWSRVQNAGQVVNMMTGRVRTLRRPSRSVRPWERFFVCGAAILIRTSVIKRIGGFDRRLFLFWEDADFCLRAVQAGFKIEVAEGAKAIHLGSQTTRHLGPELRFFHMRNMTWFIRRHGTLLELIAFLLVSILVHTPRALGGAILRRSAAEIIATARGMWEGWLRATHPDVALGNGPAGS